MAGAVRYQSATGGSGLQSEEAGMQESQSSPHFEGAELVLQSGSEQNSIDARSLISTLLVYVAKSDGREREKDGR